MKNILYYFSATGNSLDATKKIAAKLSDCEVVSIAKVIDIEQKVDVDILGIIFPVYMFGLPLIVEKFLEKLKDVKVNYCFLINTFGGLAGTTLKEAAKILNSNNITVNAAYHLKIIDNYIPFFKIPGDNKINEIILKSDKYLENIIKKILSYEEVPVKINRGLLGFLFSKLLYKISISQVRKLGKKYWVEDTCNGCGICEKVCPVNNIKLKDNKPYWLNHCEHCLACVHWCPKECIQFKKMTIGKKRYHHPNIKVSDLC